MNKIPSVVLILIAINALLFLPSLVAPEIGKTLEAHLALYFPKNEAFQVWQLFTYMFLHGSPAHIFFNMFALASFGTPLTLIWGTRRFLTFYFVTGVGAALVYSAVNYYQFSGDYKQLIALGFTPDSLKLLLETFQVDPVLAEKVPRRTLEGILGLYHSPAIGASGAIYGILVAFGVLFPNARLSLLFLPVPVAAKYFIPAIVGLDLFSGITGFSLFGGGIAHWAHVGGALIGFLIMLYWRTKPIRHPQTGPE